MCIQITVLQHYSLAFSCTAQDLKQPIDGSGKVQQFYTSVTVIEYR